MASLLIIKGANQNQRFDLNRERTVIGRNPDCDLIVSGSPAVSRQHAQIVRVENEFYLEDLQSRNKTYLNNQEVGGRVLLHDEDRIRICDFLCTFHEGMVRLPLPPEMCKDAEPADEENEPDSTVRSTVDGATDSRLILDTQPADRLKIMLEITNDLTQTLELEPLFPKIIDKLFQIFRQADRGFIILRDEVTRQLIPKTVKTRREKDEVNARFSRKIVNQCIDNGQAILSEDASADQRFQMSQSVSDFRIRSVMCTPLAGQNGKVFGVIQLDTQDRNKKFVDDDLQLLVAVSNQAALAMESARMHEEMMERERMEREMHVAKEVQRAFLPLHLPTVPNYEFFAHYEAAFELAGDFYNFISLPNQRLAITVGDVAGKGVPAALLMARLSAHARYCMLSEADPALAVTRLNELLHQEGLADRFVTLGLAVLDPVNHSIQVVNAGHLAPLVRRASTGTIDEIASGDLAGMPLGIIDKYEYCSCRINLHPGDCVVICTDGIIDAMSANEEAFGQDRLLTAVKASPPSPTRLGRQLLRAVEQHAAGHHQHDDITLVCFGRLPA